MNETPGDGQVRSISVKQEMEFSKKCVGSVSEERDRCGRGRTRRTRTFEQTGRFWPGMNIASGLGSIVCTHSVVHRELHHGCQDTAGVPHTAAAASEASAGAGEQDAAGAGVAPEGLSRRRQVG